MYKEKAEFVALAKLLRDEAKTLDDKAAIHANMKLAGVLESHARRMKEPESRIRRTAKNLEKIRQDRKALQKQRDAGREGGD